MPPPAHRSRSAAEPQILRLAKAGDVEGLQALDPRTPADVVDRVGYGFTPLGWACFNSHVDAALLILDRFKVDVNAAAPAAYGGTVASPLHLAASPNKYQIAGPADVEERHDRLVRALLAKGADPHHRDCTGNTAYSRALFGQVWRIADTLEEAGCGPKDMFRLFGRPAQLVETLREGPDLLEVKELLRRGAQLPTSAEMRVLREQTYRDEPGAQRKVARIETLFRDKARLQVAREAPPKARRPQPLVRLSGRVVEIREREGQISAVVQSGTDLVRVMAAGEAAAALQALKGKAAAILVRGRSDEDGFRAISARAVGARSRQEEAVR